MADVLHHEQCPQCAANGNDNSRDNMAVYSDGGKHCFACGYHVHGTEDWNEQSMSVENIKDFSEESKQKIKDSTSTKGKGYRGLDDKITGPFGVRYEYDESTGAVAKQYYPVTIKGELSGYKIRKHPKSFLSVGETGKVCDLFGQFKFKTGGKYVLLTGGECFPGDVEVLTECGFVRFDHLEKGMKVYQHSFEATGDFVVPYAYTEKDYKGNLVRTKSSRYDVICTENHNMVYVTQTDKIVVQPASQHFSAGWNLPVTSSYSGCGINLTNDEIALVIAICADSKLDHRVRTNKQAHFAFVKERKIIRLKGILDRLEIPYTSYTNTWAEGKTYTTFNLKIPDYVSDKFLPVSWLKDATREQAEFILNEIIHWDGNLVKERDAFEFNSKHKREVDFVQAMATLVGRYAAVRFRKNQYGEWWSTRVSGKKNKVSCQAIKKTTEYFEGKVYCVSVPTGMIIVRNNGKIAVVGNCDQLSAYQMLREYQLSKSGGEDYTPIAVVSPTIGENCKKQIQKQYDFLNQFERIVVGFDNDEAGRKATEDVIDVLPRGKVWIANWSYKDPNEYLVNGKSREFIRDFYNAEKHTPAGVIASDKIFEEVLKRAESDKLPFAPFLDGLNEMLAGGITYGFIVNILAGSGAGKCHGKGQEILMHDLSLKKVEDIRIGDKVMGQDGSPRTVLTLHNGVDMLYRVTPNKGLPYVVNSKHLLVIESNKTVKSRGIIRDSRFTISAEDFYNLPRGYRERNFSGVRANLVNFGNGNYEDEAYILGLWLAEGTTMKPQFTLGRKDQEVHDALFEYVKRNNYRLNVSPSCDRKGSVSYDVSGGYLVKLREEFGVLGNKHIPEKFIKADYSTRLELLAGFLDGDGYATSGGFEMTLKDNQLAKDIILLAKTLGLSVKSKKKWCKCQNFDGDWYVRIHIYGGADRIPNRVKRKKVVNTPNKNIYRATLKIEIEGVGEYYGFEVDGDHLYCLPDMQITHNSSIINENVIHWTKKLDVKVGVVSLEADAGYYGEQLLSRYIGKKIALIDNKEDKVKLLTSDDTKRLAHELFTSVDGSPSFYILDDRGDFSQLQDKIEELVVAFGVRVIIIDVISDVFAGMTIEQVDKWMQWEKCLVKQYNCILVNIAHVRKASGGEQAGSQGAFLTEESILGSGSQFRSAGINISLQRDKNAEDEVERNTTYVHLLKSRDTGMTGKACEVYYDLKSHTLYDKEYYFSHVT